MTTPSRQKRAELAERAILLLCELGDRLDVWTSVDANRDYRFDGTVAEDILSRFKDWQAEAVHLAFGVTEDPET